MKLSVIFRLSDELVQCRLFVEGRPAGEFTLSRSKFDQLAYAWSEKVEFIQEASAEATP